MGHGLLDLFIRRIESGDVVVGDWQSTIFSEGAGGYSDSWWCLPAFVFGSVHKLHDFLHDFSVEAERFEFHRTAVLLDVTFEDLVE